MPESSAASVTKPKMSRMEERELEKKKRMKEKYVIPLFPGCVVVAPWKGQVIIYCVCVCVCVCNFISPCRVASLKLIPRVYCGQIKWVFSCGRMLTVRMGVSLNGFPPSYPSPRAVELLLEEQYCLMPCC